MACIFCRIVSGQAPAEILFQDQDVTAFRDIHPVAPVHVLLVPNRHLTSVNDVTPADEAMLGHLFGVARQLADGLGVAAQGYRMIVNTGADGGQVVPHLHVHLIGGRRMRHPMG
ncbi:MAG: histidine triad nucleotide-binding protein [Anaerolineales bacterium]